MINIFTVVILHLVVSTTTLRVGSSRNRDRAEAYSQRRLGRLDECILFKSNDTYTARIQESFLELGDRTINGNRNFEISFNVLPSSNNHDGPLFAIGTENFAYYEWKTKAVKTQFLVVEFFYSALSVLMKALGTNHMSQIEIHRNFPTQYYLNDVRWHKVLVRRNVPKDGTPSTWFLQLDDDPELTVTRNITEADDNTHIHMESARAYLGGRPGYRSSQFRGIIKNLLINGEKESLSGLATYGLVEVWHCSAPEVRNFEQELEDEVSWDYGYMGRNGRMGDHGNHDDTY